MFWPNPPLLFAMRLMRTNLLEVQFRVTRLGDFLPIGRLSKVDGNFLKKKNSPKKWRFLGRILGL
jgi:hypothetical protein